MSITSDRSFELVANGGVSREVFGDDWPIRAGSVGGSVAKRACLLHIAYGRWLVHDPDQELERRLDELVKAGVALLIDVTGKWTSVPMAEPNASRVLATGVAVEIVLAERECASIWLFDCPVVLARTGSQLALWVQSSYAPSFCATLASIVNRSEA